LTAVLAPTIPFLAAAAAVLWGLSLPASAYAASLADSAAQLLAAAVYGFGSVICHQISERSFHLFAEQLPVCARCTGLYAGAAAIAVPYLFRGARRPWSTVVPGSAYVRWLLVIASLPVALSIVWEWATGEVPSNIVRAITGVLLGGAVARVILDALAGSARSPRK
jgi:uncharacterized membrane protein